PSQTATVGQALMRPRKHGTPLCVEGGARSRRRRVMNWRLGLALAVVGGGLIAWGVMEWWLGRGASATPERISLKALIARGPQGNPNIILTDFELCDNYVVEKKNGAWHGVYVPVVPAGEGVREGGPARPSNVKAVLFSLNVHNDAEITNLLGKREL